MAVYLFGDQTTSQEQFLRQIAARKENGLLTTFLEQARRVVLAEIHLLPHTQRTVFPSFTSIVSLVDNYVAMKTKIPALESCLTTITQLAHFIGYHEDTSTSYPNPATMRVIGLCTGLLAAAAVVSARSLSELLPVALEATRLSFRIGNLADKVGRNIAGECAGSSWSTIVTGVSQSDVETIISDYYKDSNTSEVSRPYISAVGTAAVTISGARLVTKQFFEECTAIKARTCVPISVFAPYHARKLYHETAIDGLFDADTQHSLKAIDLSRDQTQCRLHSSSDGKLHQFQHALDLMRFVAEEILFNPIQWESVLEQAVGQIVEEGNESLTVTTLGLATIAGSFVVAVKAGGQQNVNIVDLNSWDCQDNKKGSSFQVDKIAIVGISGRFPSAANVEALWALLMANLDVHRRVPSDRWDIDAHYDPSGKGRNKSHSPYGCFIDNPGLFDPKFFNMSPREAAQTDPMGRLALVTAYEAMEMAGIVINRTPSTRADRIGTFCGQTSDDWREIQAAQDVDTYFITGGVRAFAPGRINYTMNLPGPSFSIDTACSSSLAAIHLACLALKAGDCDTVCASGVNVFTNPDIFSGLSKGQFLSKTGNCKTYDNDADGYCRGEGCGTVILKRYSDAIADKDVILGTILGAGTNHSAEAVSITHPHAGAQINLFSRVLAEAGVDAHDITYVEMHGTGTQAGDDIEMKSVSTAFAPPHRRRRPDQPLYLGAIKANIGHGEAASGINSLAKLIMMMRYNEIPANVGVKSGVMNRNFPKDLAERNVHIPLKNTPMPRDGAKKRKFFLNNFSAAGGNSSLLLEDGPLREEPRGTDPRSHHIVTITARAISSLKKNIADLIWYCDDHQGTTLESLSYTTTARRIQHNYRVSFVTKNMSSARVDLRAQLKDTYSPIAMKPTECAWAFTGQGSHYTSLGKQLYEQLPSFAADIDELDAIVRLHSLPSFMPILNGIDIATLSPVVVQLGMSCIQVALARMWSSWGLKPVAVIGHSLGEYAALHIAGVYSVTDMIRLVGGRASLLLAHCTEYSHGMIAVKASEDKIASILGSDMTEVACRNSPEETVLCGTSEAMATAHATLEAHGVKATILRVPFAFHSAQIDAIMESFQTLANSVQYSKPTIPIISPLLCGVVQEEGMIGANYLPRHARETVDFCSAISAAYDAKICTEKTAWLEIGAHPVCSALIKASIPEVTVAVPSLRRGEETWKTITTSMSALFLAGVYINFDEYHRAFNDAHELLALPTYNFDEKNYWIEYRNNWTLTKGDASTTVAAPIAVAPTAPVSKLSTTSCQRIVREELHANSGVVVVQSDLAEPKLAIAVSGHRVNGAPLCPSSLFADQALTISDYLYKQLRPGQPPIGFNVCRMEVAKPLVAKIPAPAEGQHIQIEALADIETAQAMLKWRSVTPAGVVTQEHASCVVKFEPLAEWADLWDTSSYMVQAQIASLRKKLATDEANKILRGVAYKLFTALVDYDERYQGMDSVILDNLDTEAMATIAFKTKPEDGNFYCAPYWIDSLCHISGFICNGTSLIDSSQNVYISHGWGSMRFAKAFSAEKKYTSYVRMRSRPNNVLAGDVWIFEGDEVVGVVGGLKFQQIPRRVLNVMLPPIGAKTSTMVATTATITPVAAPARIAAPIVVSSKAQCAPAPKPIIAKPAKTSNPSTSAASVVSKVMQIIAIETDVDMSELVDEAAFENLGVDSLMSLTISAKFREDLELDIPSTLFTDHPTIGEMKRYFSAYDGGEIDHSSGSSYVDVSDESTPQLISNNNSTPASTPPSVSDDEEIAEKSALLDSEASVAHKIMAEEMGVLLSEIDDKADLGEMGMDSLMSLTVLSRLREETGQDLPGEFLLTNPTLEEVEFALDMRKKVRPAAPVTTVARTRTTPTHPTTTTALQAVSMKLQTGLRDVSNCPPASSLILQGSVRNSTRTLFLLPDGSGSSTSYMGIPTLSKDWAVYGLTCPFLKTPERWTVGVDGIAQLYIREIKRRQPKGPYILGGWSAGGVAAYETVCQLLAGGDTVEKMVLIDCPSPAMAAYPLPPNLHIFFDEIGLLGPKGKGSAPPWLLPHFAAAIKALSEYIPQAIPRALRPQALLIICREGVCGKPGDPRPAPHALGCPPPMRWLLDDRTDFGPNGWEELLDDVQIEVMDGNHFTMMGGEHAKTLGALIQKGLGIVS